MLKINEIELYYDPRSEILPLLGETYNEPEMTVDESAFLCGICKKKSPSKITEVGIAGGGTTAILLQCMKDLKLTDTELHSVDYSEMFYRNNKYQSGFLGNEAKRILFPENNVKHQFHLGNVACAFVDELKDTDLLIIDTTHAMPGEFLDFITLLPVLKDGTIVVLHDISLNHYCRNLTQYGLAEFCTGALLAVVTADKYVNYLDTENKYANIGAFIVSKETRKHICNVFMGLMITWQYMPDNRQLLEYRNCIKKYYATDLLNIFDSAVVFNRNTIARANDVYNNIIEKYNNVIMDFKARIDIQVIGIKNKIVATKLEIDDIKSHVSMPKWFQKNGSGYVVESVSGDLNASLHLKESATVKIYLRGIDYRINDKRQIKYIDYTKLSINGKILFNERKSAWHDEPIVYVVKLIDTNDLNINIQWMPYKAKNE